jgi:hypothetical protein
MTLARVGLLVAYFASTMRGLHAVRRRRAWLGVTVGAALSLLVLIGWDKLGLLS